MTLIPGQQLRGAPTLSEYRRQSKIPKEDRCRVCDGMAVVRVQNSMIGRDWRQCFACQGSGRDDGA